MDRTSKLLPKQLFAVRIKYRPNGDGVARPRLESDVTLHKTKAGAEGHAARILKWNYTDETVEVMQARMEWDVLDEQHGPMVRSERWNR